MSLEQILRENAEHLGSTVIPLHPFLRTKAKYADDRVLKERLNAMGGVMNLVPNTVVWNQHFKTTGPTLTDALTDDGRRLILENDPSSAATREIIGEDLYD